MGIYGAAVGCVPFEPKIAAEKLEKDPVGRQAKASKACLVSVRHHVNHTTKKKNVFHRLGVL